MTTALPRRSLAATLYLVGGGIVAFVVMIVLPAALAIGIGLLPAFLVGVPVLLVTMEGWRLLARAERARAAIVTGRPIDPPLRAERAPGLLARWRAFVTDRATWKELLWAVLLIPLGTVGGTVAVVGWALTVALVLLPVAAAIAPEGSSLADVAWAVTLLGPVAGALAAITTAAATIVLAEGLVALGTSLLGPDERSALAARVDTLQTTRAGAVESADQTLRRIERDLHDGAQHRLAYVAMELGRARQKLHSDDPAAAASLIDNAFAESKNAMAELRDLVRGIHPSVLADRGLAAAVSGLAGRCPVPVAVSIDVPERPPVAVETAAYFVIAEALTNVGKHSGATQASVDVTQGDEGLTIVVRDDGRGGAAVASGGGLGGLAQRVAALDGTLEVDSPAGGGTTVKAVL